MRIGSPNLTRSLSVLVLSAGLILAGCDDDSSPTSVDTSDETTITGTVTDDPGFAKAREIDDADVRASEIDDEGNRSTSDGETTTDENGRYTLRTSADARVMVVTATKADFSSETIVMKHPDDDAVAAMTMNAETRAEADVYVESKRQDSNAEPVTAGDVALHVDSRTAAEISGNVASATQVAAAIRAGIEGEMRYLAETGAASNAEMQSSVDNKHNAFVQLQSSLSSESNTEAAMESFVSTMARVHTDAGIGADANAEARQTASLIIEYMSSGMSDEARFALRQNAELLAAVSTSEAVEAEFRAGSGMEAEADAVASAGLSLRSAILSADSEADIQAAWSVFESDVEARLASGISLGTTLLTAARSSLASLRTEFQSSVSGATTVDAFVAAKTEFRSDARAAIASDLATLAEAEFAARVLTLVSAR